jgi:hypothetical protein
MLRFSFFFDLAGKNVLTEGLIVCLQYDEQCDDDDKDHNDDDDDASLFSPLNNETKKTDWFLVTNYSFIRVSDVLVHISSLMVLVTENTLHEKKYLPNRSADGRCSGF